MRPFSRVAAPPGRTLLVTVVVLTLLAATRAPAWVQVATQPLRPADDELGRANVRGVVADSLRLLMME